MAWVMARVCASVNVPRRGVPRWPLVPDAPRWLGSARSGPRSKYSRSSRAGSISRSLGAGLPARGDIAISQLLSRLRHRARLRAPDACRILGDGAVAGELTGTSHIPDGLARPVIR